MAKKVSEVKKVDKKIEKLKAPGNKLKIALKAAKKLTYTDLIQLSKAINDRLEAQKQLQIENLEQQLKLIKES
jgi:hypothetical protein